MNIKILFKYLSSFILWVFICYKYYCLYIYIYYYLYILLLLKAFWVTSNNQVII